MTGVPPPLFVNVRTTCALTAIWTLGRINLIHSAARVGDVEVGAVQWNVGSLAARGLITVKNNVARPDHSHPYRKQVAAVVRAFAARFEVRAIAREAVGYITRAHAPGSTDLFGGGPANEILIVLAACGVCFPRAMLEVAPVRSVLFARRFHEFEAAGIIRTAHYRSYRLASLNPDFFAAVQLHDLLVALVKRDRPSYRHRAQEHRTRWPFLSDARALQELGWPAPIAAETRRSK